MAVVIQKIAIRVRSIINLRLSARRLRGGWIPPSTDHRWDLSGPGPRESAEPAGRLFTYATLLVFGAVVATAEEDCLSNLDATSHVVAALRASDSIAAEGSGISVVFSSPWHRIVIANWATGAARAASCDTSFGSRTCAMPTEPGAGIVLPLTSSVWCEPLDKIIRRKLMPSCSDISVAG